MKIKAHEPVILMHNDKYANIFNAPKAPKYLILLYDINLLYIILLIYYYTLAYVVIDIYIFSIEYSVIYQQRIKCAICVIPRDGLRGVMTI